MSEVKIDLPVWDVEGRAAAAADRRAETTAMSRGVAILEAKTEVMAAAKTDVPPKVEPRRGVVVGAVGPGRSRHLIATDRIR